MWSLTQETPWARESAIQDMASVTVGLIQLRKSVTPLTRAAWRFPAAPSQVVVERAAAWAISSDPSWRMAALNSWAEISPFSIASLKFPV